MMLRRRGLMTQSCGDIPFGYKRCKYLESLGTQWIDTGVVDIWTEYAHHFFKLECRLQEYNNDFGYGIIGIDNNWNHSLFSYGKEIRWTNKPGTCFIVNATNDFYEFICEKDRLSVNSSEVIMSSDNKNKKYEAENIIIFPKTYRGRSSCKIFSLEIYTENETVRNFIPALDRSGKPCMFDTVTNQPFYNDGTGKFGYELMDGTYVSPV